MADGREFQYTTLTGIGSAAKEDALDAGKSGTETEEAYISLLDVVEDDGNHEPKLEQSGAAASTPATATRNPASDAGPSTSGRAELPWARASMKIRSPSLRLHNEIVAFCQFLEPTPEEATMRQEAVDRIAELVTSIFPSAKVKPFGSFVTGLYLPTSDVDLVVLDSGCSDIVRGLRAIGNKLVDGAMAKNIQVISKAKVPIIKFDDIESGIPFDISFDAANGPKTAAYVQRLMSSLPPMRPLAVILKLFLQQRELNEVYQGGIGSYALLVMVASFLLQHRSRTGPYGSANTLEPSLGILLLDFFHLFGRTLNYEDVALSCRNGGSYFRKSSRRGFLQYDRPHFLAVEDPQDESNDLCKGSYNIQRVQKAFEFAYQQLSSPVEPMDSLLERIVRLDAVLMSRTPQIQQQQQPQISAGGSDMDLGWEPDSKAGGSGKSGASSGKKRRRHESPARGKGKKSHKQSRSGSPRGSEKHSHKLRGSSRREKHKRRRERDF